MLRPDDRGAPHDAYFTALNESLKAGGPGRPVLIVDLDRLERNCKRLTQSLNGKQYRVVAKSMPSAGLIAHVMQHTGFTRVMSFHQPFVNLLAKDMPRADILLGKPMPVQAAATFYRRFDTAGSFDPRSQLQWLIDTPDRLAQYQQLARTLGAQVRINVEIDVGLHRGGLTAVEQLPPMLATIAADPRHLSFAGFMGYDAHVGRIPPLIESRDASLAKVLNTYHSYIDCVRANQPAMMNDALVLNGAGSPTFRLHGKDSPLNEVSVGSALVKPADYDLELLADFEPASFIATPVIKAWDGLHLPGAEAVGKVWTVWDRNRQRSFFIYGGSGSASYTSPQGLTDNPEYEGMINASRAVHLEVDDYIFLRPNQSEGVFLQFGDLALVRNGRIEAWWPVFNPGHEVS
ncbi:MAG: alanine racemase [Burkholderiaceae bacterium]|nr:alanine racemase [Burkholderiaceae bacterium]